jgi:hypothetical protein
VNILIISVTLVVVAVPEGTSPAHTNILELTSYRPTPCRHSRAGLRNEADD